MTGMTTVSAAPPRPVRPKQRPADPLLSVVCPVYDEEETIDVFYRRVKSALEGLRHEIVFVNDGSADRSAEILRGICAADRDTKLLDLSRNFGHQLAITSGIDHAAGDAVVVIDSDLQDPPEVIVRMLERWRDGYDVVYGVRSQRAGESRMKLTTAKTFYRLLNRLSDTPLPLDAGDFRLMDRSAVDALRELREENRYIRGMVSWVGFDQVGLPYERDARYAGETKYPLRRMLRLATDAVTSFSERPLRLAFALGTLITVIALALVLWFVVAKIIDPSESVPGYTSLMVVVLFFGGIQLLSIGLLGEYVGRIYRESKERPLYVVADRVNFDA